MEVTPQTSPGLDNKELQKLLHSDEMHHALDYTFNKHNSTYNIRVVKKVISTLVTGALTIDELREARMSFMLYEGELCSGIPLDEASVLSSLRVTGKAIAPKKLQEWIKQLIPDVPGRVQLYEFCDLIKLAKQGYIGCVFLSDDSKTFQLTDSSFLLTPDQKLHRKMDDDYELQSQQIMPKEKHSKDASKNTSKEKNGGRIENHQEEYMLMKSAGKKTNQIKRTNSTLPISIDKPNGGKSGSAYAVPHTAPASFLFDHSSRNNKDSLEEDQFKAISDGRMAAADIFPEAKDVGIPNRSSWSRIEPFVQTNLSPKESKQKPRKKSSTAPSFKKPTAGFPDIGAWKQEKAPPPVAHKVRTNRSADTIIRHEL
ncbi:hypothetical protein PROFUN_12411 [Planoprotostelium fungivorum]|uniref:Uncharacterized protein n=1 Tax=Planoprotostelium fungivorum TaxID=1890364 RepID=A0A2P6N7J0_9EUKA|nr:hypothetical protein PROFUN_12411 [Planoprotostelium fungivorum]